MLDLTPINIIGLMTSEIKEVVNQCHVQRKSDMKTTYYEHYLNQSDPTPAETTVHNLRTQLYGLHMRVTAFMKNYDLARNEGGFSESETASLNVKRVLIKLWGML